MLWLHTKALLVFQQNNKKNSHPLWIPCLPRIGIVCYNLTLPPFFSSKAQRGQLNRKWKSEIDYRTFTQLQQWVLTALMSVLIYWVHWQDKAGSASLLPLPLYPYFPHSLLRRTINDSAWAPYITYNNKISTKSQGFLRFFKVFSRKVRVVVR